MKERFYYLLIMLLLAFGGTFAQIPVIQKIEPQISFPKSRIVITGSGFSPTPAQLQVWFDQVRGTIIASTEFSIEVEVPPQARLTNVTVVNLVSRLSANSKLKFMPAFSGEGFDPTKLNTPVSITSSNAIFDIASADIDGDNKPDLIGSRFENTATTMLLLMNQSTVGNITFANTSLTALNINAPTGHLAVGDLNGDGKPDVVASRSGTTANTVFVLGNTSTIGNPNFVLSPPLSLELTHFARQVAISDLNGDGKPEIVVANSASNDLYIFKNESAGGILTINPTPIKITVTGASETLALELQDMDGDGKTDIVASRNQSQDIFILKNTSTLSAFTFGTIFKITIPGQLNDLATADFNRDGKMDIVATSLFSAQAQVLLNKSSTTSFVFDAPITLATDAQPFGLDVSDLNGDNFPDFIIPNRGTNTLNAYLHNGNISAVGFTKVSIPTNKTNWFVRAGDLDGDAKPDIAFTSFTNPSTFSVDILRNKNCHNHKY
jgi:FG-GAP-like repeat/IPT/TIG domain